MMMMKDEMRLSNLLTQVQALRDHAMLSSPTHVSTQGLTPMLESEWLRPRGIMLG